MAFSTASLGLCGRIQNKGVYAWLSLSWKVSTTHQIRGGVAKEALALAGELGQEGGAQHAFSPFPENLLQMTRAVVSSSSATEVPRSHLLDLVPESGRAECIPRPLAEQVDILQ